MIDEVTAIDFEAATISARALTPEKSPVFDGHFPGMPLVPGVLLIETMAQASGFYVIARSDFASMPFLMTVDSAKMRTFVTPSTPLSIEAQILHEGSGFCVAKARVTSEGKRICEAELKLRVMPAENVELARLVRRRAEEIGLVRAIDVSRASRNPGGTE
jgi:3-hydroxyacyl-[acyl-carrier-protein] dehydratase